jgi:predicted DNA-binding transcriptional regulator AlpA
MPAARNATATQLVSKKGEPGIIPFSPATLWRKVAAGEFPAPVKLSAGVTAWRVEEVRAWMETPR